MDSKRNSMLRGFQMTPRLSPDPKRRRLSLLPPNTKLGAPRLLNSNKRQSNTPDLQEMVQRAVARNTMTGISGTNNNNNNNNNNNTNNSSRRASKLPSSSSNPTPLRYQKPPIDPRPLKDPEFQLQMQNDLFDYLSDNKFDIEMNYPLSQRSVKNPTQKEFVFIFQWLYNRIDPGYKFLRSIEQEVYSLLKLLDYPYLETINKSQISAVGGSNWHVFLGMLYWLLKLVIETIKFDNFDLNSIQKQHNLDDGEFEEEEEEIGGNNPDDSVIKGEQSLIDKLFVNYALKSYKSFLSFGEDNYSEYLYEMENEYNSYMESVSSKINSLKTDNDNLKSILNSTQRKHNEFKSQIDRSKALESDVLKFNNYIDIQTQRRQKWPIVIQKLQNDIDNIKNSIIDIQKEKESIINDLNNRNFTLLEIERMHKERSNLTFELNEIDLNQQNLKKLNDSKLNSLKLKFNELNSLIDNYNMKLYKTINLLQLPTPIDSNTLTISNLSPDYITTKFGLQPTDIINTINPLKHSIQTLKLNVSSHSSTLQDELLTLQDQLDDLNLNLVSKNDSFEDWNLKLKNVRESYNELSIKHQNDSSLKQFEFDERSNEMKLINSQLNDQLNQIDIKWNEIQKNLKLKSIKINENRNLLMVKLAEKLDSIINLKGDIINDLDNGLNSLNL